MKFDRSFYIGKGMRKVADKASTAVAYVSEENGKFYAKGFYGKRTKPSFFYRFSTEARRTAYVTDFFNNIRLSEEATVRRREERKAQPNRLEVGMILYSSWGYDQTNIDWYEVVEVPSKCFVVIEKIGGQRASDSPDSGLSSMAEYVVPNPAYRTGEKMRKKVQGTSVRLASYASASPWDGKPKYCSWYA
ncbi:MAG TPA: hypothetical protein VFJ18_07340 [Pararhizobium sp.]|nr:hypothetical protein [Pararhizobium sp.]